MQGNQRQVDDLSAYLDGELPQRERGRVERLLRDSAEARLLLLDLERTRRLVGTLPRERAPRGLSREVLARLERSELLGAAAAPLHVAPPRSRWVFPSAIAAAFVVLAGGGSIYYLSLREESSRSAARVQAPIQVADSEQPVRMGVASSGAERELLQESAIAPNPADGMDPIALLTKVKRPVPKDAATDRNAAFRPDKRGAAASGVRSAIESPQPSAPAKTARLAESLPTPDLTTVRTMAVTADAAVNQRVRELLERWRMPSGELLAEPVAPSNEDGETGQDDGPAGSEVIELRLDSGDAARVLGELEAMLAREPSSPRWTLDDARLADAPPPSPEAAAAPKTTQPTRVIRLRIVLLSPAASQPTSQGADRG